MQPAPTISNENYPSIGQKEELAENVFYSVIKKWAVATPEDFERLAEETQGGRVQADEIYLQTADLDMTGYANVRIGETLPFPATYDGQNHTIFNYSITDGADYTAMFPTLSGTVRNLKIKNASVKGNAYSAVVVGCTDGTDSLIENVHVEDSVYIKTGNTSGAAILLGAAGSADDAFTVKNCTVSGCSVTVSATSNKYNAGFIVGKCRGAASTIENCYVWDNTFTVTNEIKFLNVGGIIGESLNTAILNCGAYNNTYTGTNLINLGGLAGQGITTAFTMKNCYTDATVAVANVEAPVNVQENNYVSRTAAEIESGKLAYALKASGNWVQKNMPMIAEGQEPFSVTLLCKDEGMVLYTDENGRLIGEVPEAFAWERDDGVLNSQELQATVFTEDAVFAECSYMLGDLNGSGALELADVVLLMQYLVGYDVKLKAPSDFNGDGRTSIFDAVLFLKEFSGESEASVATAKPSAW